MKTDLARVCLGCGHPLDAATSMDGQPATPNPGDISVCAECGHMQVFTEDGFRQLNAEEASDVNLYEVRVRARLILEDLRAEKRRVAV